MRRVPFLAAVLWALLLPAPSVWATPRLEARRPAAAPAHEAPRSSKRVRSPRRPASTRLEQTVFAKPEKPRNVVIIGDFSQSIEASLALNDALASPMVRLQGVITTGLHRERNADIVKRIFDAFGKNIDVGIGTAYAGGEASVIKKYNDTHRHSRGISYEAAELLGVNPTSEDVVRKALAACEQSGEPLYAVNFNELTELGGLPKDMLQKFAGLYLMGQAEVSKRGRILPDSEAANMKNDYEAALRVAKLNIPQFYIGKYAARSAPITPQQVLALGDKPLARAFIGHAKESVERFIHSRPETYQAAYGLAEDPRKLKLEDLPGWSNPYHMFTLRAVTDPEAFAPRVRGKAVLAAQRAEDVREHASLAALRDDSLERVRKYIDENHSLGFQLIRSPDQIVFPKLRRGQVPVLVDTDIFRDPDDLAALHYLVGHPKLVPVGFIAESMIPYRRAKGLYQVLRSFGLHHLPIAEGYALPMGHLDPLETDSTFLRRKDGRLRLAEGLTHVFHDPVEMVRRATDEFKGKLRILGISPMRSLAEAQLRDPRVYAKARFAFQGQADIDAHGRISPNFEAYNFGSDPTAANIVIGAADALDVPMDFFGKYGAYAIRKAKLVTKSFFTGLASTGHLAARALLQNAIDGLIPFAKRTPDIFRKVFGLPDDADVMAAINEGTIALSPYDLGAAVMLDPKSKDLLAPKKVGKNRLVGNTADDPGVPDPRALMEHAVQYMHAAVN